MYLNMTVEQVISQLYTKWSGEGAENEAIIAAASLLERVRVAVGDDTKVSDAIRIMNDVAHAQEKKL